MIRFSLFVNIVWLLIALWFFSGQTVPASAQTGDKNWKTFVSAYDFKDAVTTGNTVWIASYGGVMEWNPDTKKFTPFTNTDGLSGNFCTAIAYDNLRTIIVAHKEGVLDFFNMDTRQWHNYNSLSGNIINHLAVLGDTLLISMDQGFAIMDLNTETVISFTPKMNTLPVNTPVIQSAFDSLYIWCLTAGAAARISRTSANFQAPSEWKIYNQFSANSLYSIAGFNNKIYLYSQGAGVFVYDRNSDLFVPFSDGLSGGSFRFSRTQDEFFCYNAQAVYKVNGTGWENLNFSLVDTAGAAFQNKFFLRTTGQNNIIMDYSGSVFIFQNNQWRSSRPNAPGGNYFADMLVRKNQLWCASLGTYGFDGSGFYKYDIASDVWSNMNSGNVTGLATNNFLSITMDDSDKIWFGTWAYGVTKIDMNTRQAQVFSAVNGLSSYRDFCNTDIVTVNGVGYDPRGYIWIALHGPCDLSRVLSVYNLSTKEFCYYSSTQLGTQNPGRFMIDAQGKLWITTYPVDNSSSIGKGIIYLSPPSDICQADNATVQSLTTADGLISNNTTAIAMDKDGVIWIGMDKGLQSYSGQVSEQYLYPDGPIGEYIQDIEVDRFNNKWFATQNGVSLLTSGGSWVHYTSVNSKLVNNNVKSVACSEDGKYIYFGTHDYGMSRLINPAAGSLTSSSVTAYPNPFIIGEHTSLTFTSVPDKAVLKIFTISGELIRSIDIKGVGQSVIWDGRNTKGHYVSSGVYLYNISPAADASVKFKSSTGKFAVIKK